MQQFATIKTSHIDHIPLDPDNTRHGAVSKQFSSLPLLDSPVDCHALRFKIEIGQRGLTTEVIELRRAVYVDEWNIMEEANLVSPDDAKGIHVLVFEKASNRLVACTHMVEAEQSTFVEQSGLLSSDLTRAVLSSRTVVAKDFRQSGLFQSLMYPAFRYYRMLGRRFVVAYVETGEHPTHRRYKMAPLKNANSRQVILPHRTIDLAPYIMTIDYALYGSTKDLPSTFQPLVQQLMVSEIETQVREWAMKVNDAAIWSRARNGTLTKYQYGEFLAQLHQFVRFTTRVIALAMSRAEEKKLRNHFRKHMVEEVDHEVIIESDLKHLGLDVDYLVRDLPPNPYICNFNGLQESLLANRHNPVLYMAIPFAVEGISATISDENLDALIAVAGTWGIGDPKTVTRFLASHRDFDGQDGGHWDMTLDMIGEYVKTERDGKWFLTYAKATIINISGMMTEVAGPLDFDHWQNVKAINEKDNQWRSSRVESEQKENTNR